MKVRFFLLGIPLFFNALAQDQESEEESSKVQHSALLDLGTTHLRTDDQVFSTSQVSLQNELNIEMTDSIMLQFDLFLTHYNSPLEADPIFANSLNYRVTKAPLWSKAEDSTLSEVDIHTFYLNYFNDSFGIKLGRQQISHGSAYLMNVSDIFNSQLGVLKDTEKKPGVDAFRFTYLFENGVELEVIGMAQKDFSKPTGVVKASGGFADFGLSSYVGGMEKEFLWALDINRPLFDMSFYLESLLRKTKEKTDIRSTLGGAGRVLKVNYILELYYFKEVQQTKNMFQLVTNLSKEFDVSQVSLTVKGSLQNKDNHQTIISVQHRPHDDFLFFVRHATEFSRFDKFNDAAHLFQVGFRGFL